MGSVRRSGTCALLSRSGRSYNASVQATLFDEMKSSIGFDGRDTANVRSLAPYAIPAIPAVVHHFYEQLLQHASARALLTGGDVQLAGLHETLSTWLREVFEGPWDETYYQKRRRIGSAHLRVGLPQYYMFTGMELIWQALEQRLREAGIQDVHAKLGALHRLLVLDLAIMLESFQESHSEQVRKFERSAVEAKLTRAEHLAEIGQLAASLAHEIKNPLAGISGAIQIIQEGMRRDDPHQPIITEILGQIGRLDATVKDLLQYARPTPPRATKVSLDAVARRVLNVLREEPALQRTRIIYSGAPLDPTVYADDGQIEQLLINLIINAAHASDDGGAIHLAITADAGCVLLIVRDEGNGMTRDVLSKAFEPFFTTKAKGTGLGLSICRRIAEAHGGGIELKSEVGEGTTATVSLPSSHEEEDRRIEP